MYNDDDISGTLNELGGPYQFLNQTAVNNAVVSGQNIDWAHLAQQWIQMRDSSMPAPMGKDVCPSGCDNRPDSSAHPIKKYEEKGEADMDMDDEEHVDNTVDKSRKEPSGADTRRQPANANRHWFADTSNSGKSGSHQWNQWSNTQPLLQPSCAPISLSSQINQTAHIPSLLNINVPHPNEIRALLDSPNEQEQTHFIDAAKRKVLPAWIREGLEKMEREKQKQAGKKEMDRPEAPGNNSPVHSNIATVNCFSSEELSDENDNIAEDEMPVVDPKTKPLNEISVQINEDGNKSYEQKLSELMIIVRGTLTELLLEVTNEEISKVATEAIKYHKMKASSAQVIHNCALSSITGKLGLAAYDDSSTDECSNDEQDDNNSMKKIFQSDGGDDSEEDLKNTIRTKRRAFVKIANVIEDQVTAAAVKEEEKIKCFSNKEVVDASSQKSKWPERTVCSDQAEIQSKEHIALQLSSGCSGKNFEKDTGETTETLLQVLNGKRQKERGTRKERTTRFSDNRDSKYLAIHASVSYFKEMQSKETLSNSITSQAIVNKCQTTSKINELLPSYTSAGHSNFKSAVGDGISCTTKQGILPSSEKLEECYRDNACLKTRRRTSRDSPSHSISSSTSTSTSTSSSSSSSDSDSSTSKSSQNSRYSHKSLTTHSSKTLNTEKTKSSRQNQTDKRCDYKDYSSRHEKKRDTYSRSRNERSRSRSRSRHRRNRHRSPDSDDDYNRYKQSSRYSSHSRYRRYHDFSASNSRSYSSSSRRH